MVVILVKYLKDEYSIDQILASQMVFEPLTKLQCCPTSDGSAAAVVVSEDFLVKNGLEEQVSIEVIIKSQASKA